MSNLVLYASLLSFFTWDFYPIFMTICQCFLVLFMGILFKVFYAIFCYFTWRNFLVKSVAPSSFYFNFKVISDFARDQIFKYFWFFDERFRYWLFFRIACMPPWRSFEVGVELFYAIWRYYRLSAPDMALELSIVCFSLFKIIF